MRRLRSLAFALVAAAPLSACAADADTPPEESAPADEAVEWQALFDGSTLEGWTNPYEWGTASVQDGEIHLTGDQKFFLVTDEEFDDFVFEGEVLLPDTNSNAGFMFRANVEPNRVYGYQAEVDPTGRRWAGGLYDEGRRAWLNPPARDSAAAETFRNGPGTAFHPTDWNSYRIQAVGDSIKIWVNDVLTTAYSDTVDSSGPIGIQHHGEDGKVYRYRNLRIRDVE